MKLLIRNLDRNISEEQLQTLFKPYGAIQSCNILLDKVTGESKGFGFIEMPKAGEAKVAMKNLNGKEIHGSRIRVKKAEDKSSVPESSRQKSIKSEKTNKKFNPYRQT